MEPMGPESTISFPPPIKTILEQIDRLRKQYDQTGDPRFLNESIDAWEAVVRNPEFTGMHLGLQIQGLDSAGKAYLYRYQIMKRAADRDRGLALHQQAVMRVPREWPEFPDLLNNLAKALGSRYHQTRETRHFQEFEAMVRQLPDSCSDLAAHLNTLGIGFVVRHENTGDLADLQEAIRNFKKAVKQTPADSPDFANRLNNLAMALWSQYDHTHDAHRFQEFEQVMRQLPPSYLPLHLNNVGIGLLSRYEATSDIADLQEAIRSFERVLEETPAPGSAAPAPSPWLRSLLSWLHFLIGIRRSQPSSPREHEESPQNRRCRCLSNLGTALMDRYSLTGIPADLEQAIQVSEQAVDQSPKGSSELPARLATLGDVLRLRYLQTRVPADLNAAIRKVEFSVACTPPGSPDLPSILVSLGIGLIDRYELEGEVRDLNSAIDHLRQATSTVAPSSSERPAYWNSLGTALSRLYQRTGNIADLDEAVRSFDEALNLAKLTSSKTPRVLNYLNNLSNALAFRYEHTHVRSDLDAAIKHLHAVISNTNGGSPALPSFLANLGSRLSSLYQETKDPADLTATIEAWERGLRRLHASYVRASVASKVGGAKTWPALYTNLIGAYLARMTIEPETAQSSLRRAVEVAEQSKSYLLAEQFSRADIPIPTGISAEQAHREKQLLSDLTKFDAMELAAYDQLQAKQGVVEVQRLQQREQYREELQRIWALMEQCGPQSADYVALRRGDAPLWNDLVRLAEDVGPDTALLSLITSRDNAVIFIMRQGRDPRWIDGKISEAAWNDVWSKLVQEVHNYDRKRDSGETWDRPLRSLLEQTCRELGSVKRIILAPHALGHLIPWSVAIAHLGLRGPNECPLLPVVTVPTLKLAAGVRPPSSSQTGGALVVGNPRGDLPFAEKEARAVAEKLGTRALVGRQATKEAVLKGLASASVVHLATHAFLSKGSPMDSGVVLADGILTAREVIQCRLSTNLLVLSACETGLGTSLGGDELAGLGHAFMYAGAHSMLVSLWKVNDMATAALMVAFYEAYCRDLNKTEALSQAMAKVRAEQSWQHSYYWGSFTLMGNWN
jgi:tetratricopeptide (TPR) repeat protein